MASPWDAIVLAGGKGERLGGVSKPELVIGGRTLLDRTLDAVADARAVVVVGGPRHEGVRWTVESPVYAGPAAAVAAGMRELAPDAERAPWTVVLAVDTPGAAGAVPRLLEAIRAAGGDPRDGAHLIDEGGRTQSLIAVYRTARLEAAVAGLPATPNGHDPVAGNHSGLSMRTLVDGLDLIPVADRGDTAHDVDTWDDVNLWKDRLQ